MPAFLIPAIAGALLTVASSLVGRIIMALGMAAVTYTGVNAALSYFATRFGDAVSGAGEVAGMLGVLQLDVCFSIFTAAALAKLVIAGATSGTIKRLVLK